MRTSLRERTSFLLFLRRSFNCSERARNVPRETRDRRRRRVYFVFLASGKTRYA